jgi:hypothetical protein
LKDCLRVKILLEDHKDVTVTSILIGRDKSVMLKYLQIAQEFHLNIDQPENYSAL